MQSVDARNVGGLMSSGSNEPTSETLVVAAFRVQSFEREIGIMATIRHPNGEIRSSHDVWQVHPVCALLYSMFATAWHLP